MREIEEQFKNQINFVVVDGTAEKNFDLVRAPRRHHAHHCQSPWWHVYLIPLRLAS